MWSVMINGERNEWQTGKSNVKLDSSKKNEKINHVTHQFLPYLRGA